MKRFLPIRVVSIAEVTSNMLRRPFSSSEVLTKLFMVRADNGVIGCREFGRVDIEGSGFIFGER